MGAGHPAPWCWLDCWRRVWLGSFRAGLGVWRRVIEASLADMAAFTYIRIIEYTEGYACARGCLAILGGALTGSTANFTIAGPGYMAVISASV